jgi:signal transduction histidine kinase
LHDGLGPTLAGLALSLGTAQALSAGQPDLHEAAGQAHSGITAGGDRSAPHCLRAAAVRSMSSAWRGPARQAGRFRCQAPTLAISLDAPIKGGPDLPRWSRWLLPHRDEALASVARHAHATRCAVRIHLDHGIHVDVRDNGAKPADTGGPVSAIASMRERVSELGGNW